MGDLLSFSPHRTTTEMEFHVDSIIRSFPAHERSEIASELIDKARRRNVIDDAQVETLRGMFCQSEASPV